jgi:dihydropteroate synthase
MGGGCQNVWRCRGRAISLDRPQIMGIVNVTPDSFSDGGLWDGAPDRAAAHGLALLEAGADILDVGGESTRPGAAAVALDEELTRVMPVIRELSRRTQAPLSIDTRKAAVARAALAAGACIINDVTALGGDPEMRRVAAETGAGVVLMHGRGTPQTMNGLAVYQDVVGEVCEELRAAVDAARAAGVAPEAIMVDPGFGFAKETEHNVALLRDLARLTALAPVLVGLSRKRFIGALTGRTVPAERMAGSVAAAMLAVQRGASVVRVHDVRETADALRVRVAVEPGERRGARC